MMLTVTFFGGLAGRAVAQAGNPACPCISSLISDPVVGAQISQYREGDKLVFTPPGSSAKYYKALSYGTGECKAHDDGAPPSCVSGDKPGWCSAKWCYVSASNCNGVSKVLTRYFPIAEELYFSYATCAGAGSSNTVDQWSDTDTQVAQNVIEVIEDYGRTARFQLEDVRSKHNPGGDASDSAWTCSDSGRGTCPCPECRDNAIWNSKVDFLQTGYLAGRSGTPLEKQRAACLSSGISATYKTVAAKEADASLQRVGYQYFGDQASGGYTSWPREEMCKANETGYDPRARPWYAAAATGPKDVIIIADVSGSMGTADRHLLAQNAVKKILDTMTWKDFATIILFNNGVKAVYSETMVPLTDANRNAMFQWCDMQTWRGGGTNFAAPIERAFEILEKSTLGGQTSMCQKAIMFLTDGEDDSYSDYSFLQSKATAFDAIVFTYALGTGADTSKTKRMACMNRGVFYAVPDGADLAAIMSSYYEYFAYGQEMCSASFITYSSATGGQTLYTGCMAAYDRTQPSPSLLGVTCMDVSLLTDVTAWKSRAGWDFFACAATDMTKQCRQVDLMECHRQKIRRAYSQDSVCSETAEQREFESAGDSTVCPCRDQNCVDDATFTDELGYFCDTWVGDDCQNPNPAWGYSPAGMAVVREKCPKSCNLCEWSRGSCGRTVAAECPVIPVAQECRACLGRTSGVDIDQKPMACPPGAPRNIAPTETPTPTVSHGVALHPSAAFMALAGAAALVV